MSDISLPLFLITILLSLIIKSYSLFGFTNNFYKKYMYEDGDLFAEFNKFDKSYIHKWAMADGKWGGQEGEFERWAPFGAKFFIIGECWINHLKKSDWYKARVLSNEFGWHITEGYQDAP